jgi:hypothetical protein
MKRRVKRYNEGELVDGDDIPMDTEARRSMSDRMMNKPAERTGGYTSPVKQSFKEAFAEAVSDKKKTFEYNGKRYTTEMAREKRSRSSKYDDVAKSSDLGSQDFSVKTTPAKKEESSSSAIPIALGGASAAAALAKLAMSKRGEGKEPSLSERVKAREAGKSQSGSTVGKMPGSSLSDPYSMQLGSDLDVRRTLRGNKRMGMDSRDTEFKKGGKVSSASSRADGIAQRGKTKGRIC